MPQNNTTNQDSGSTPCNRSDIMTANDRDMRTLENQVLAGRYRLEEYIAEGGFGSVYRASHVAFELELREVAIKLAKHPMDDREARSVFADAMKMIQMVEAAGHRSIGHHFLAIHDVGRCPPEGPLAGHPYIVMELIRGGSLRTCLAAGSFPLKRASEYFDQMLEAVAFMHRGVQTPNGQYEPIIHRDIKPGNLLVVRNANAPDVIKISDFGLAVQVDQLLGWATSGGDLAYLAPESFSHDICSRKTDVYMLALVFYEMVTGHSPFARVGQHLKGDSEAKRRELRRLHLEARQREQFNLLEQDVEIAKRPELIKVIRRALTVDMNARPYEDAGQLLAAWREARKGTPSEKEEETAWEKVHRLTGEAEQCLSVGNRSQGQMLLHQAMALNADRHAVPDHMLVGRAYFLMVRLLLADGQADQAVKVATEGYHRRRCRSTCEAMARCYEDMNETMSRRFRQEAQTFDELE